MGTMRLSQVAKYADIRELPKSEQDKLIRRKKLNRRLSQFGGATGVAALTLRAPQFARVAGARSARLKGTKAMAQLARLEPKATKVSDAVGTVAIGSGAINSFNWAKIQAAETKADRARIAKSQTDVVKANPLSAVKVLDHIESGAPVPILHVNDKRKERKRKGQLVPVAKEDRFLRTYRDRISPDAERGYLYLKAGRNRQRRESAGAAATSMVASGAAAHYIGRPITGTKTKMRVVGGKVLEDKTIIRGARRAPVIAGVAGAAAAASGALAVDRARGAHRWNSKMGKIEARAKQRARDGQWGRDRRGDVAKALIRVPTGMRRGYGVRAGGLMRRGSKTFTRRGSIQGSGRLFR